MDICLNHFNNPAFFMFDLELYSLLSVRSVKTSGFYFSQESARVQTSFQSSVH